MSQINNLDSPKESSNEYVSLNFKAYKKICPNAPYKNDRKIKLPQELAQKTCPNAPYKHDRKIKLPPIAIKRLSF